MARHLIWRGFRLNGRGSHDVARARAQPRVRAERRFLLMLQISPRCMHFALLAVSQCSDLCQCRHAFAFRGSKFRGRNSLCGHSHEHGHGHTHEHMDDAGTTSDPEPVLRFCALTAETTYPNLVQCRQVRGSRAPEGGGPQLRGAGFHCRHRRSRWQVRTKTSTRKTWVVHAVSKGYTTVTTEQSFHRD